MQAKQESFDHVIQEDINLLQFSIEKGVNSDKVRKSKNKKGNDIISKQFKGRVYSFYFNGESKVLFRTLHY